ncbi:hypothetical protein BdWA1_000297 [Babesia duncani]|uniref:Uncharacterized protein n=1 Tax=Babesia duncani TaxID=323732 RepID=A0AAD9PM44_9APIC|nr:hypothetical protein BdWA1_000297 [Babesia duncani]
MDNSRINMPPMHYSQPAPQQGMEWNSNSESKDMQGYSGPNIQMPGMPLYSESGSEGMYNTNFDNFNPNMMMPQECTVSSVPTSKQPIMHQPISNYGMPQGTLVEAPQMGYNQMQWNPMSPYSMNPRVHQMQPPQRPPMESPGPGHVQAMYPSSNGMVDPHKLANHHNSTKAASPNLDKRQRKVVNTNLSFQEAAAAMTCMDNNPNTAKYFMHPQMVVPPPQMMTSEPLMKSPSLDSNKGFVDYSQNVFRNRAPSIPEIASNTTSPMQKPSMPKSPMPVPKSPMPVPKSPMPMPPMPISVPLLNKMMHPHPMIRYGDGNCQRMNVVEEMALEKLMSPNVDPDKVCSPAILMEAFQQGLSNRKKRIRNCFIEDYRHAIGENPRIDAQFKTIEVNGVKLFSLRDVLVALLPYHVFYYDNLLKGHQPVVPPDYSSIIHEVNEMQEQVEAYHASIHSPTSSRVVCFTFISCMCPR